MWNVSGAGSGTVPTREMVSSSGTSRCCTVSRPSGCASTSLSCAWTGRSPTGGRTDAGSGELQLRGSLRAANSRCSIRGTATGAGGRVGPNVLSKLIDCWRPSTSKVALPRACHGEGPESDMSRLTESSGEPS